MTLQEFFKEHPRCALGFSGGTDSTYLLWAAKKIGADVLPFFVKTPFQPRFELEDAETIARQLEFPLTVIPLDLPQRVFENPENRCYLCKRSIFTLLKNQAESANCPVLLDGTNASDEPAERPGMRALDEIGVFSPLRLCGMTKADVRKASKEAGLPTWDKPAYACLATRFPAGVLITQNGLQSVEQAEHLLLTLGFSNFRVRVFYGTARIQVKPEQMLLLLQNRKIIVSELRKFFSGVTLDLEGRP